MHSNRCSRCILVVVTLLVSTGLGAHATAIEPGVTGVRHDIDPNQLLSIDMSNGALAELAPIAPSPLTGLAYDNHSGTLWGVHPFEYRLYTIDVVTGDAMPVGDVGAIGVENVNALAFNPNENVLYTADIVTDHLIEIDPSSGIGTVIASLGAYVDIEGMAYDAVRDVLYGLSDDSDRLVRIDTTTGATVPVGPGFDVKRWRGLAYDPLVNLLYATTVLPGELYSIDPTTGMETFISSLDSGDASIQGLAFVPTPGSAALFALTSLVCGGRRRGACPAKLG